MAHAGSFEAIQSESRVDSLTGLANRRAYDETLGRETSRAVRYGSELSLILFDLDGFKAVNDTYGHPRVDAVLAEVGRILAAASRVSDQAFRIGDEEFALILPETPASGAQLVADRIARDVAECPSLQGLVTISAGVAEAHSLDPRAVHAAGTVSGALGAAADARLYEAKRALGTTR
jgi:diguanylate cyclase (GGDEF)-like protein